VGKVHTDNCMYTKETKTLKSTSSRLTIFSGLENTHHKYYLKLLKKSQKKNEEDKAFKCFCNQIKSKKKKEKKVKRKRFVCQKK